MNLNRIARWFIYMGVFQCILAGLLFVFFSTQNLTEFREEWPAIYLALLSLLLIGYAGPVVLVLGVFLWTLTKGLVIKILGFCVVLLPILSFMPIPLECTYSGDTGQCDIISPLKMKFWSSLWQGISTGTIGEPSLNLEIRWVNFGGFFYLDQGFGDVLKEMKRTSSIL